MPFDRFTYWQEYRRKNAEKYALKRSPLISKPVKLKPISEKRKKELREYEKVKAKFFQTVTVCQANLEGCTYRVTDLHHLAGRVGKELTNSKNFMGLCRSCHSFIHDNMSSLEAMRKGYKV